MRTNTPHCWSRLFVIPEMPNFMIRQEQRTESPKGSSKTLPRACREPELHALGWEPGPVCPEMFTAWGSRAPSMNLLSLPAHAAPLCGTHVFLHSFGSHRCTQRDQIVQISCLHSEQSTKAVGIAHPRYRMQPAKHSHCQLPEPNTRWWLKPSPPGSTDVSSAALCRVGSQGGDLRGAGMKANSPEKQRWGASGRGQLLSETHCCWHRRVSKPRRGD